MKRFFDLTFKPFFVLTGIGTALGALIAFWPKWAAERLVKIAFVQEYTIILQHWGFMLGVMGVFMIVAAYREDWRTPILIFGLCEKAFFVCLVVAARVTRIRRASGPVPGWMRRSFSTPSVISECMALVQTR